MIIRVIFSVKNNIVLYCFTIKIMRSNGKEKIFLINDIFLGRLENALFLFISWSLFPPLNTPNSPLTYIYRAGHICNSKHVDFVRTSWIGYGFRLV